MTSYDSKDVKEAVDLVSQMKQDAGSTAQDNMGKIGAVANDIADTDQEINDKTDALFRELLTYMMENPRNIEACTHLLFISKNLERSGDQVTNIAEQVHYLVTGDLLEE